MYHAHAGVVYREKRKKKKKKRNKKKKRELLPSLRSLCFSPDCIVSDVLDLHAINLYPRGGRGFWFQSCLGVYITERVEYYIN